MYDPTFELVWRENREEQDEFSLLLSIGCERDEAAEILDVGLLSFGEWLEIYGKSEEVSPETDYSTLVII